MIRWAAGLVRRAVGALLLLALVTCGAEVALRLCELRSPRSAAPRRNASALQSITVPSWSVQQELCPQSVIRVKSPGASAAHEVRINSFGLRGPEVVTPKPTDVYRVVCLGDERVLGAHHHESDVLSAQLQERLQQATKLRVEVWNAGIPGACPLTEFLLLTHRLGALQPDIVVAAVNEGDLVEDSLYRRFTRTDADGAPLACRHPTLGRTPKKNCLTAWRQEFRLVDLGLQWAGEAWRQKTELEHTYDIDGTLPDISRLRHDRPTIERTVQPLGHLAEWCRKSYATLCVLHVREPNIPANSELTTMLQDLSQSERFLLIDVARTKEFADSARKAAWAHEEHREFAAHIAEALLADVAGPWNSPYFRDQPRTITPTKHEVTQEPKLPDFRR